MPRAEHTFYMVTATHTQAKKSTPRHRENDEEKERMNERTSHTSNTCNSFASQRNSYKTTLSIYILCMCIKYDEWKRTSIGPRCLVFKWEAKRKQQVERAAWCICGVCVCVFVYCCCCWFCCCWFHYFLSIQYIYNFFSFSLRHISPSKQPTHQLDCMPLLNTWFALIKSRVKVIFYTLFQTLYRLH